MGGLSLWHWLILAIFIFPIFKIVGRAGFSPFWAILAFVPLVNFIALWVFAFVKWPVDEKESLGDVFE